MKRRKLPPLESPDWRPIAGLLEHRRQQTRESKLVAQEFNRVLKDGRLQTLVQYADGRREVLEASAWEDLHISGWDQLLAVFSRKLGARPPGQWFYVWLPDYKNIFGDSHAISSPPAQTQEVPEKRGRKASHDWPKIGFELVRRVEKMGRAAGNKSTNSWATELERWHEGRNQKAPANSDLREYIDDVLRALRIERK